MRPWSFARAAFFVAALTFGGCGGIQNALPAEAPSAVANPDAGHDLLYVSNANGTVSVFRYWQHALVTVLTDFGRPMGECADPAGNVYIADYQRNKIDEYAHGAKKPAKVLDDSPYAPYACSVAPSNGRRGSKLPIRLSKIRQHRHLSPRSR
jgi:hypothetical protein